MRNSYENSKASFSLKLIEGNFNNYKNSSSSTTTVFLPGYKQVVVKNLSMLMVCFSKNIFILSNNYCIFGLYPSL